MSLYDSFHEFRVDWMPQQASFYFDGAWIRIWDLVDKNVPVEPSTMLLSHWSNGAPGWSQGPPEKDAVMTISYFKAYFNSSDAIRVEDHANRCRDQSAPGAVCVVPDQQGAPDDANAGTFFFSAQMNQTVNQTVYTGISSAGVHCSAWSWILICVAGATVFMAF
jgi:beta-glucanase (GH16 family)